MKKREFNTLLITMIVVFIFVMITFMIIISELDKISSKLDVVVSTNDSTLTSSVSDTTIKEIVPTIIGDEKPISNLTNIYSIAITLSDDDEYIMVVGKTNERFSVPFLFTGYISFFNDEFGVLAKQVLGEEESKVLSFSECTELGLISLFSEKFPNYSIDEMNVSEEFFNIRKDESVNFY